MKYKLLLCILSFALFVILSHGFAIVGKNNVAITAGKIENGAQVSMKSYDPKTVIADNQDWLIDTKAGQIYLKFYENFVLGPNYAGSLLLYDKTKLNDVTHTQWNITKSGTGYIIASVFFHEALAYSGNRVFVSNGQSVFQFFDLFPTFDYVIVGAGTAGAKIAKRLSDDHTTSVGAIEAGKRVNDDPFIQNIYNLRKIFEDSDYNYCYYTETNDYLLGIKSPAGVGRMWGGTSGHNGFLWDKGLKYDWDIMKKYGGANWNYDGIKSEYFRSENYTGPIKDAFGSTGEVSLSETPPIPSATTDPVINATSRIYPYFVPGPGMNLQELGSATSFQMTMQDLGNNNYIRESSATAHLYEAIVDKNGHGVNGRKLEVMSFAFVDKLIFHPVFTKRAIGVQYVDEDAESHIVYANKEIILSAGVYGSSSVLMRSGVGNCSELAEFNIPCTENNVYVGSNFQDHISFQVMFTAPPQSVVGLTDRLLSQRRLVEGRVFSPIAHLYTDYSITNETQPDSKIELLVLPALSGIPAMLNANNKDALTLPIFSLTVILMRAKSLGKVSLVSSNPTSYLKIESNYLSHPDDRNWTRSMFRETQKIIDELTKIDSRYKSVYPTKSMIEDDATLDQIVAALTGTYNHPAGTCRMAPRDDVNRGVVNGNLCVYGLQNVRVMDASVFPIEHAGNLQAPIYAGAGIAAKLIKTTTCT